MGTASTCGECGMRFMRQVTGVIKTSAILISTREDEGFYGSLREVPPRLRSRLEEATNGANSGTIVIADKGGRKRILARAEAVPEQPDLEVARDSRPVWAVWVGVLLLVMATIIIVLVWGKWPKV